MTPNETDLELACRLAKEAGAAILAVKTRAIAGASLKADTSPVTEADLASDKIIRAGLGRHRQNDVVVTEETWSGSVIGRHPRAWFIDPLDGTEDFVAGRADYAVQIGLCVDGKPALGVVHHPESGVTWRGVVHDLRCERVDANGVVRSLRVDGRAMGTPRIAISVSHPSEVVERIVSELGGVAVRRGSVGLKVGLIVDDEADAYVSASTHIKVWDSCAPAAVLLAAGGVVGGLDGSALEFDGPAPHAHGVSMWTPAARDVLAPRVAEAVRRYRASAPR